MNKGEKKISKLPVLWRLFLGLPLLILLSGCQLGLGETTQTVILPAKTEISIEGLYAFEELFSLEGEEFIDESGFRTFGAQFTLKSAQVGLEEVTQPSYVGKLVNTFDYFLEKYRINPTELGINQEQMEVVTISTSTKQFYEIFKLGDDELALVKGTNFIKLSRAKEGQIVNFSGNANPTNPDDNDSFEPIAGILIGLRGKREETTKDPVYRTLWITNDGELQDVYEIDDILFPRKEFWTLKVLPEAGESSQETLEIKAITGNLKDVDQETIQKYDGEGLELTFIGNNYISLLIKKDKADLLNKATQLMTISLDKKNLFTPVSILDLEGAEGESAFIQSLEEKIGTLMYQNLPEGTLEEYKKNFILRRHHGNWRIESKIMQEDKVVRVPVAFKPSAQVVTYDDLPISWQEIKRKIPQAQDAFCAPGNSFILVRTPKYLSMYGIDENNKLSETPMQRIEIDETEEVIMSEWARGDFVSRWTDVVAKIGRRIIFVQN